MGSQRVIQNQAIRLRWLGNYLLLGGVAGLGIAMWSFAHIIQPTGVVLLLYALIFGFCVHTIFCARLLLKGLLENGLWNTKLNLILQTLQFSVMGYTWEVCAGLGVILGYDFNTYKPTFATIIPNFSIVLNGGNDDLTIGINVIALLAFIYVDRFERQLERELSVFEN
ncbi:hypothetical protein ACFOET_08645 [Parapedobacter deserti]|uniref:DUF2975 domain-containing protein n=1 Tax=Parapedobacter deserti TaxID=1912957 RepID=A0ABV7JMY0_9SPHI